VTGNGPIAVVGVSGLFPGALDVGALWANTLARQDATAAVRAERWTAPPALMVRAEPQPDRAYSDRCCLLPEFRLDPAGLSLEATPPETLDPLHRVVLQAARDLLLGDRRPHLNRSRTGVILAAIVLPTESASALTRALFAPLLAGTVTGGSAARAPEARSQRRGQAAARVTGLPAALVAQAFGLGGATCTLDAACASSLYAVKLACDALRSGRADAVVTGGVSRPDALFTQVGFSQLRALSPTGRCAPFDRSANGLVVGEGAGLLLLKRLDDALSDGDDVLGLIRGVGLSNDLRGNLLAPDSEGQLRAMRAAYQRSGWTPGEVDYIECHGAGTPTGDRTELASLEALRAETDPGRTPCTIGSVKSMIGHLLTAAGAAGAIRTLLAMRHRVLPSTLHFSAPPDGSPLEKGPLRVLTDPAEWERRDGRPRRAAVSAFGFGGINAHLLLEEWEPEGRPAARRGRARQAQAELPLAVPQRQAGEDPGRKHPVAVTGMAIRLGPTVGLSRFAAALRERHTLIGPRPAGRWKGCDELLPGLDTLAGAYIDAVSLPASRFRIPPVEIPDILPQHLLMLQVAAEAMRDAGLPLREERPGMGAVIGIDFDFGATDFHLRWHLAQAFPGWVRAHAPDAEATVVDRWLAQTMDACAPPLTATRVLGSLGSMVASRIAREFRLGGPSFVVSAEAASGLAALEIGTRAIRSGEVECALIGAVDLGGDLRSALLKQGPDPAGAPVPPADGAVALVLKQLDRARADGDPIYAVVRGLGSAGAGRDADALAEALSDAVVADAALGVRITHGRRGGVATPDDDLRALAGDCGATGGLAALVAAVLRLHDSPPAVRFALAGADTADGNSHRVVLERPAPELVKALHDEDPAPTEPPVVMASGGRPLRLPPPPADLRPVPLPPTAPYPAPARPGFGAAAAGLAAASEATARAHAAFLEISAELTRTCARALEVQRQLLERGGHALPPPAAAPPPPAAFDRSQCLEFARGSAARVLGPEFAEVDSFAARVRLPDEPLMLVDRIVEIHGRKGGLGPGRIVTEHDVLPGAWYLDGGRAPVCIAVEAGQADLFLSAWLGIDLAVRGRRTYRLLDATVEFHRELPAPGETIRYAIAIEKFLRQGDTYLFLFRFDGSIAGRPLITMTGGCAGFFTPEEVANSGGIILGEDERRPQAGRRPPDWAELVPLAAESYDERALDALRAGDAAACFGEAFSGITLPAELRLPGGRMRLIDRVLGLEPQGGRYGLGRIRAEADIHSDDWFLTCHFVDDRVMPGTLMYECCAHALRVLVQRMGWVGDAPALRYAPLAGVRAVLKCRGPVTPATRRVVYEVHLREVGYRPEPFVLADADMYADGHHIVRFRNMSLQLKGATRESLTAFWSQRRIPTPPAAAPPVPVFTRDRLEAFARGNPSQAFGPPYAPFDVDRFIARLPAPPYLCMDRVRRTGNAPWVLAPGDWTEAEYDVPPGAWYLAAERTGLVPYCILLEAALQPCGWLAAWMGSALKSRKAMHFRNLGGKAIQHREVPADIGTLRTRVRLTQVSEVPDMLIQHFDFEVHGRAGLLYGGSTYFGFFTPEALGRQEGLRPDPADPAARADAPPGAPIALPDAPPLSPDDATRLPGEGLLLPARALRMLDRAEVLTNGGRVGLGRLRGEKRVDPDEWFFKAHFFQDPVWPGSLGLESFLQLLKAAALHLRPDLLRTHRFAPAVGREHRWSYRGQVLPTNREVTLEAEITEIAESSATTVFANGLLGVDGLPIYRMEGFGVSLVAHER
jgi:3-oxoacyl-(acyl-carrier-protein) synthase/3-hydroxymyristoyl/3-hydroxydecanoyl-(acyl carrier protein) dehydratase